MLLIAVGRFRLGTGEPWLLDDLVVELLARGVEVDVLVNDLDSLRPRGLQQLGLAGLRVYSVGPTRPTRGFSRLMAYAGGAHRLSQIARRMSRSGCRYDLVLYHSICFLSGGAPKWIRRSDKATNLVCMIWDFFPTHHIQIGRLPAFAEGILKHLERRSVRHADVVTAMSPENAAFLCRYHGVSPSRVIVVPPWASSGVVPCAADKFDEFTVIFGGQLEAGRGMDDLVRAAAILADRGVPARILIVGRGRCRDQLAEQIRTASLTNVELLDALPKEQYLELLGRCHVGIAATVAGVNVPTFPSKLGEYCRMGVPVIAALEDSTDAGEMVEAAGAGIRARAGDPEAIAAAVERMWRIHSLGGLGEYEAAARRFYESSLSVSRAVDALLRTAAGLETVGRDGS